MLKNLAIVLEDLNNLEHSELIHAEILQTERKIVPKNTVNICDALFNLAIVKQKLNKFEEAQKIHEECLEIKKRCYP